MGNLLLMRLLVGELVTFNSVASNLVASIVLCALVNFPLCCQRLLGVSERGVSPAPNFELVIVKRNVADPASGFLPLSSSASISR